MRISRIGRSLEIPEAHKPDAPGPLAGRSGLAEMSELANCAYTWASASVACNWRSTIWLWDQAISKARAARLGSRYLAINASAAARVSAMPKMMCQLAEVSDWITMPWRIATIGSSTEPSLLESGPTSSNAAGLATERQRPMNLARSVS